ncbi:hypothetical protein MTO96_034750 [Rhipicephalus appendiculatus]
MAFAAPPPKEHCFALSAPECSTVDDVIDALEAVSGPAGIKSLQHMGGVKFGAAAANDSAASKLKSRAAILLNGVSVLLISVGPEIVHLSVFRVPLWVGDAALAAALRPTVMSNKYTNQLSRAAQESAPASEWPELR